MVQIHYANGCSPELKCGVDCIILSGGMVVMKF